MSNNRSLHYIAGGIFTAGVAASLVVGDATNLELTQVSAQGPTAEEALSEAPIYLKEGVDFNVIQWTPDLSNPNPTSNQQIATLGQGMSPSELAKVQTILHTDGKPFISDSAVNLGLIPNPSAQIITPQGLFYTNLNPNPGMNGTKIPDGWELAGAGCEGKNVLTPNGYNGTTGVNINGAGCSPVLFSRFKIDEAILNSTGYNTPTRISLMCKSIFAGGTVYPIHVAFVDPVNGARLIGSFDLGDCPTNGFGELVFYVDINQQMALSQRRGSFEVQLLGRASDSKVVVDNFDELLPSRTSSVEIVPVDINENPQTVQAIWFCGWPFSDSSCDQRVLNTNRWQRDIWTGQMIRGYVRRTDGVSVDYSCSPQSGNCGQTEVLVDFPTTVNSNGIVVPAKPSDTTTNTEQQSRNSASGVTESDVGTAGDFHLFLPLIHKSCLQFPGNSVCYTPEILLSMVNGANTIIGIDQLIAANAVSSEAATTSQSQEVTTGNLEPAQAPQPGEAYFKMGVGAIVRGDTPNKTYHSTTQPFWAKLIGYTANGGLTSTVYKFYQRGNAFMDEQDWHALHNCMVYQNGRCYMIFNNPTLDMLPYTDTDINKLKEGTIISSGNIVLYGKQAIFTAVLKDGVVTVFAYFQSPIKILGEETRIVGWHVIPDNGVSVLSSN